MTKPDKLYDEEALKNIQGRLVDPWHKTFAKDVIELYETLKQSNKPTDLCDECHGEGRVTTDTATCISCNGSGKRTKTSGG